MIGDPAQRRGPTTDWPRLPVIGVAIAIAITTTMDATGLFNFSALPLFPLALLFWRLERLPRQRLGLVWCHWRGYGMALLHPVVVLSMIVAIALAAGLVVLDKIPVIRYDASGEPPAIRSAP